MHTTFDPLQALSLARTALDDPGGLPEGELDEWERNEEVELDVYGSIQTHGASTNYAIDRIDEVMGALSFEAGAGNDDAAQARWVLTHLGRLIAEVADELDRSGVRHDLMAALDRVDETIDELSNGWPGEIEG